MAEQSQAGEYKNKTRDQLRWPPAFSDHDAVLKILAKVLEQTKSNTSGEYTLFKFSTPQCFAEFKIAMRAINNEVDCYSSRLQLDPQLTDTTKAEAPLKKHNLSTILITSPYIFTNVWKGEFSHMYKQYLEYQSRVHNNKLWEQFEGKSEAHAVAVFVDKMQYVTPNCAVDAMVKIISEVASGGLRPAPKKQQKKKGDKGDKGEKPTKKGDPNKKKGDKGGGKKGDTGEKASGFLAICDFVCTEITEQYEISMDDIKADKEFCSPEAGAIMKLSTWGGKAIKCTFGDKCKRDHAHTKQKLAGLTKKTKAAPAASGETTTGGGGEAAEKKNSEGRKMPALTRIRKSAIDALDATYKIQKSKAYQEEKARIDELWKFIGDEEQSPEALKAQKECDDLKLLRVKVINQRYAGHDVEFDTAPMSPWLFLHLGFPTAGVLDHWGAWDDGKELTKEESLRYHRMDGGELDANTILQDKIKLRAGPYTFETQDIQERSYNAYVKLFDGCSKRDVIDTITHGRKAKKKGKMSWADISAIPKGSQPRQDRTFIPSFAKLDLFQAYMQLPVQDPRDNQAQLWNPFDQKMEYGVMHVLTFGNTHSVFSFCAAISESVSRMLNVIFKIPTFVYVDDIIIFASDELLQLYTDTARRLLAKLGVAVAPEKTTLCFKGQKIEILGIDFAPTEEKAEISLPEKKAALLGAKADELLRLLADGGFPTIGLDQLRKKLESFTGSVLHAIYNRRHKAGLPLTRFIFSMTKDKGVFPQKIGSARNREILRLLIQRIKASIESREVWSIKLNAAGQGRLHLMADASSSDGVVAIGGILYHLNGSSSGYTRYLRQRELPPILRGHSILVYELLAIVVAIKIFKSSIKGHNLIAHCDNTAAVFGIVKGQLHARTPTAVIAALVSECNESIPDTYTLWAYINTLANAADACTRVPKAATQVHGPKHNYYNSHKLKLHHYEEKSAPPPKRAKATSIVHPKQHVAWPLKEESIFIIWPGERWHNRNDPQAVNKRNSKWRTWMYWCFHHEPTLFFNADLIKTKQQAQLLEQLHPSVKWSTLQIYGEYLADCEYRNPENYISLVGGRLREINALERGNVRATVLMTQTFSRMARLMEDRLPQKAIPPNLAKLDLLTRREKQTFVFWTQCGLRPKSMTQVRSDMIHEEPMMGAFTRVMVPSIKIAPKQGETFAVWVPSDCLAKSMFPVDENELNRIAQKLGATGYGPRRALAIYLKLFQGMLGIQVRDLDGNVSHRFTRYKSLVDTHMGWTEGSNMWEKEYSVDCWSYQQSRFAISAKLKSWFDIVSRSESCGPGKPCRNLHYEVAEDSWFMT
eukprot:g13860.t1